MLRNKLFLNYFADVNYIECEVKKKRLISKYELVLAWVIGAGLSILTIYNAVLELSVKIK